MRQYFLPQTLFVLLLIWTIGCPTNHHARIDYSNVDLIHGSGRITLDGQPLPYAQVFFEDVEKATLAFGLTDENGRYSLMFNSVKEGVEAGNKRVQIWTARGGIEFRDKIPNENLGRGKERVPDRYNRKTELFRTVVSSKEQRTQTFDFELESKGRITPDLVPTE
ncbi:MAG: carboxypeptidase-like regulatory domain-containing protein [Planctomycetaceae bacterium]|jgi:hypothetical protein|nr:carboxypeptidase-like regulatory domain-containing protein [Planctomycetaceae bacterium]